MAAPSVGKILLFWGYIEAQLNSLILITLWRPKPIVHDVFVENAFSKKIRKIKRKFCDLPPLAPLKVEAYALLNRLTPIHRRRSILVHEHYEGIDMDDRHVFALYRARRDSGGWKWHRFTNSELDALADSIMLAHNDLQDFKVRAYSLLD